MCMTMIISMAMLTPMAIVTGKVMTMRVYLATTVAMTMTIFVANGGCFCNCYGDFYGYD